MRGQNYTRVSFGRERLAHPVTTQGYSSGQRGLTVNQLALRLRGFESLSLHQEPESHMHQQLLSLIEDSRRILITSHISPDPDAVCSVLLLGRTLLENFKDKAVVMVLEDAPLSDLGFLRQYDLVKFEPIQKTIQAEAPDLLIVVDANNYDRISRNSGANIRSAIAQKHIKTAVIDHHELAGSDEVDLMINNKRPATAEEIYALCFEQLKLRRPKDYAETALLGIISDTQRHRFDHPGYRETYRIVADLLDAGASIEKLESKLEHFNKSQLEAVSQLAANMTNSGGGYSYSFISDEFLSSWLARNRSAADLKKSVEFFVNKFIRNFEGNNWGFVVYPDIVSGPDCWAVSLRSVSGAKDVAAVARRLGGGGHVPAAGAKIKASGLKEALAKAQQAAEAV